MPPSRPSAFASSDCSSSSTTSPSATRRRRVPAWRCRPCRCRPWWSAALLGVEPLDRAQGRSGVCIAVLGVFAALASGLSAAPAGAWRGELIMTGAVLCMAFYNVWSRPFIQRSSALGFLAVGMGMRRGGAGRRRTCSPVASRSCDSFGAPQWIAGIYLGVAGGALAFILWVMALQRATPTRVANTMTVNPHRGGLARRRNSSASRSPSI